METRRDRGAWLGGGTERCLVPPQPRDKPFRLVLLGAPGIGKGTQAEMLSGRLGACHLSTGDIFRAARQPGACECTPALSAALEHMRRGALVPDETVLALVSERVGCLRCRGGFLLDGFPRTVAQAEALEKLLAGQKLQLDAVLSYEMPLEKVVARLSGRRTCKGCKAVFHTEARPPKVEGICDHCGGQLYQREDDRTEAIRVRMEAYETSTAPVAEFYRRRNLLVPIAAEGSPEKIFERTCEALGCGVALPVSRLADGASIGKALNPGRNCSSNAASPVDPAARLIAAEQSRNSSGRAPNSNNCAELSNEWRAPLSCPAYSTSRYNYEESATSEASQNIARKWREERRVSHVIG